MYQHDIKKPRIKVSTLLIVSLVIGVNDYENLITALPNYYHLSFYADRQKIANNNFNFLLVCVTKFISFFALQVQCGDWICIYIYMNI